MYTVFTAVVEFVDQQKVYYNSFVQDHGFSNLAQ